MIKRSDDADTFAAIAGARIGHTGLPGQWLSMVDHREELTDLSVSLSELSLA